MKNIKIFSLILAMLLTVQSLALPVFATQVETTEGTEPTIALPSTDITQVPDVEFGSASINYGCRSINGKTPMAGSDRILASVQSAFVYDANTQTVIYAYEPDKKLMPGSLAKIMTAMLAIEHLDLDAMITCSTQWNKTLPAGALNAKIKEGEELSVRDLLYCMMVTSANDAALNIANAVAGNQAAFVEMMNQKAKLLGCTNTNFTNCHGLDSADQYSTARDIAKITQEATKSADFRKFFATLEYDIEPTNRTEKKRELATSNHMMYERILPQFYDKRVTGGLPSYAAGSGASLSCTAEDDGMSLIVVVMGGTRTYNNNGNAKYYGNFEETQELLQMVFNNYRVCRLLYPGEMLDQFPVNGGNNKVTGHVDVALDTVLPTRVQQKNLIFRYQVENGGLSAPISKDSVIGSVQVWYGTSCITEAQMYAANPVKLDTQSGLEIQGATRDDNNITGFLIFVGVVILIILIPFTLYVAYNRLRRALRQAKRRRRRKSRRRSR